MSFDHDICAGGVMTLFLSITTIVELGCRSLKDSDLTASIFKEAFVMMVESHV